MWTEHEQDDDKLVEVFYSRREHDGSERILKWFPCPGCNMRVLITTVAFGLGMNIPDVDHVVHWGPPDDILQYWQEVGRCARDGRAGIATLYNPNHSTTNTNTDIKTYLKQTSCLRKYILNKLKLTEITEQSISNVCGGSTCCTQCS